AARDGADARATRRIEPGPRARAIRQGLRRSSSTSRGPLRAGPRPGRVAPAAARRALRLVGRGYGLLAANARGLAGRGAGFEPARGPLALIGPSMGGGARPRLRRPDLADRRRRSLLPRDGGAVATAPCPRAAQEHAARVGSLSGGATRDAGPRRDGAALR